MGSRVLQGVESSNNAFKTTGGVTYAPTGRISETKYIAIGTALNENTVLHDTPGNGQYCIQVATVSVGLKRVGPQMSPYGGVGAGWFTYYPADGGVSVNIPLPIPYTDGFFSIGLGISWIKNPSSLEGNENVPGDPDIVMSVAIAADGQTFVHPEHVQASVSTTSDWIKISDDDFLGYPLYKRFRDNRIKDDKVS
jgi:hypothetical protein